MYPIINQALKSAFNLLHTHIGSPPSPPAATLYVANSLLITLFLSLIDVILETALSAGFATYLLQPRSVYDQTGNMPPLTSAPGAPVCDLCLDMQDILCFI